MALKTRCIKCKKSIPMGESYCDEHKPNRRDYSKFKKKMNIEEDDTGELSGRKWRSVRKRVLIRDLNCCRYCLVNNYMEHRNLEVHHLRKRVDREDLIYDLDNLITLCHNHHKMLEDLPYEEQVRMLKLDERR